MMKESKYHIENNRVIFRETFNSLQETISNGASVTNVTFSKGVGEFNGTNSGISYERLSETGTISVRLVFTIGATIPNGMLIDFRGAAGGIGYIQVNTSALISTGGAVKYLNGELGSALVINTTYEAVVVASGISFHPLGDMSVGVNYFGVGEYLGSIDLIEIYNYALTAEEVANLYSGKRFHDINAHREVLNLSAQTGSIAERLGATLTNTATTVVKDSEVNTMSFNGTTSKVDCGVPDTLVGDKTFVFWMKPYGLGESDGESDSGCIFHNGKLYLRMGSSGRLYLVNDVTFRYSPNNICPLWEWSFIVITRDEVVPSIWYRNGAAAGAGSGTDAAPVAGTTNLIVGNNTGGTLAYDGLINDLRIYDGLLSAAEVSQLFSNERAKYNV